MPNLPTIRKIAIKDLAQLSKTELVDIILEQSSGIDFLMEQIRQQQESITNLELKIAQLSKDSTNSSKPPSSDMHGSTNRKSINSRKSSGRKSGGQLGRKGVTKTRVDHPDEVVVCAPEICDNCGDAFSENTDDQKTIATTQVADIPPIIPTVTEYQQASRTCKCGHVTSGTLPEGIALNVGTIQIGPSISSFLVYLNSAHHMPYERLTQICSDIFHLPLAEGTIANKLEIAGRAAISVRQTILDFLHASPWVGSDETGVRVAGKRIWQWVWQNAKASFYAISPHRDYQTVKINFGEKYQGTLIHDCYSAQNNTVAKNGHQLCHAHLLRDLQFLVDTEKSSWAHQMQNFLIRSQKAREHIWKDTFNQTIRQKVIMGYQKKLEQFIRYSLLGTGSIRLQKRFKKHKSKILHFMSTLSLPPDNNGSERAIRNAKTKQKVSGGYRSMHGAERQAALLSVIETAKKQNLNVLDVIQQLIGGKTVDLFAGG